MYTDRTKLVAENGPGSPGQVWTSNCELRGSFRKLFNALSPDQQGQAKQEALAEIERQYDGHQVNFTAYIVIAAGVRG